MRPYTSAFIILPALWVWLLPASASACATQRYLHNGSVMDVQLCTGGSLTISYVQPRAGMVKAGARSGSLLFDGREGPNGLISGQSRLFSARCGVVSYPVTGNHQGTVIVLNGTAPVRGRGCRIARYRHDNLVFTRHAAGPQVVPAQCPPGFSLSGGQCIQIGAGPAPQPAPGGRAGDWYAIAGSMRTQGQAQTRVNQLGGGAWYIMNTAQCPNFRNGYWIATAGPLSKAQAQSYSASARRYGAYVKTCN